jgi:excisionase family DNA binding protein
MEHDAYLAIEDAATELGVSRPTMWRWIKRRELPTFRFLGERRTFVRRADLARLREPIPVTSTHQPAQENEKRPVVLRKR